MQRRARRGVPGIDGWARLLVLVTLVGVSSSPAAVGDESPQQAALLERIATAHRNVTNIQGRATWRTRHRDEPASEARVQLVQFALLLPDHYRLVISKPDDESRDIFLSDGVRCEKRNILFQGDAPTSSVTPVGKDDVEITRLLTCFRLDMPVIRADFTVTAEAVATGARVILTPLHAALADQLTTITVDLDAAFVITKFTWVEPQGNIIEVTINQSQYDQPIDPKIFAITAPAALPQPAP